MRTFSFSTAAALAALTVCSATFAADLPAAGASAPAAAHHRGPSPQAIAACTGKTEGAAVTWVGRKGQQRSGTCQSVNGTLSARTGGAKPPHAAASAPAK